VLHLKFFYAKFFLDRTGARTKQFANLKGEWRKIMAYKNESLINTIELGRAIKRRREELGMSLRDVADVTQVSASTLSRIENGTGKPDADNIARLTNWLDMPVDRVMKKQGAKRRNVEAVVYYPHEATPEIVEAHLRADKNLTPETAKALSELFRVAYTQFSKPGQINKDASIRQGI
jgi:transcriptional regulator with XRE-family HTH domain